MSPELREAIEAVKAALAKSSPAPRKRTDKDLIGRWALPSGIVFRVKEIDPLTRMAVCTADTRCWNVEADMLLALLDLGELSWRGRR